MENLKIIDNYEEFKKYFTETRDYMKLEQKHRLETTGGATGLYDYSGIYFTNHYTNPKRIGFDYLDDKKGFVRYLTAEEQSELLEIIKDLQNKYIERLKKYYKRYSKNIRVSGYWANR